MTATAPPLEEMIIEQASAELHAIRLEELHESPKNPRRHYAPEPLRQLADNLRTSGQITPIVVRPRWVEGELGGFERAGYEIAAGHRRLRAAKVGGLQSLLAIVRDMTEAQFVEILNIENLQRDDLNALEEADGFVTLMRDAGYDVPKIAERVGKSVKYVYDRIKLLQLIPEAKKLLQEGTISPGHGILLARLSKEDQARAIEPRDGYRGGGGVLEAERVDEEYFPETKRDEETEGPVKAVSVRELDQWIARNVRFVPEAVDQETLAFDHPDTVDLLTTAREGKVKVVKITREYRVADEARSDTERTIGKDHWKRADGELEDQDRYGRAEPKPSKACDYSVVGLVVAGPGRGEAFLVCTNKDKCTVHWPAEVKQRAQRAKEREAAAAKSGNSQAPAAAKAPKVDPDAVPHELEQAWRTEELQARAPKIRDQVKATLDELRMLPDEIAWNLALADLSFWGGWKKVGQQQGRGVGGYTDYEDELDAMVAPELLGKGRTFESPIDAAGARGALAWKIWQARDSSGLDDAIDTAMAARHKAYRKEQTSAAAKGKPARAPGKKGKR